MVNKLDKAKLEVISDGNVTNGDRIAGGQGDPFDDISKFRIDPNRTEGVGVKKLVKAIRVGKPNKQTFFRVHPDPSYRFATAVVELKDERETYLVDPALWDLIPEEITYKMLIACITRQGDPFLWSIGLPGPDGRHNEWNRTALEAVLDAEKAWIRLVANMQVGAYEVYQATGNIPEPQWPNLTLKEMLRIAFKDRVIQTTDFPILKKLKGEL